MRQIAVLAMATLGACSMVPPDPAPPPAPVPAAPVARPAPAPAPAPRAPVARPAFFEPTQILSQADADRLLGNSGITLQWISWDRRGQVSVTPDERGVWMLSGSQAGADGGMLEVDGRIVEIGDGYFTLRGTVSIQNTPDPGRSCRESKTWHFAVTQNRKYYRLREFEWCDGLTDYVDIYF